MQQTSMVIMVLPRIEQPFMIFMIHAKHLEVNHYVRDSIWHF